MLFDFHIRSVQMAPTCSKQGNVIYKVEIIILMILHVNKNWGRLISSALITVLLVLMISPVAYADKHSEHVNHLGEKVCAELDSRTGKSQHGHSNHSDSQKCLYAVCLSPMLASYGSQEERSSRNMKFYVAPDQSTGAFYMLFERPPKTIL